MDKIGFFHQHMTNKCIIDSSPSSPILQKFLKLTCVTNFISIHSAETVKRLNLLRYNAVDIGIQVGELHQQLQLQIIHCFVRVV